MSKKISAEIRHQVLLLLRQGARAQSIATQLRLTKSWVQQCQYRFDLGDLSSAMTFFQGKRNETFPERFTIVS